MTLEEAQELLAKAEDAYKNSLSPLKEYDTPGGSTLKKQDPNILLEQVEYWQRQVKILTLKANGTYRGVGGIKFIQGVGE